MRGLSAAGVIGLLLLGIFIATRPEVIEPSKVRPVVLIEGDSGLLLGKTAESLPASA